MKGIIWLCATLALLLGPTEASAQGCPPTGWTLGYSEVVEGDTLWTLIADGPALVWLDEGWTDSKGAHWQLDDRLWSEGRVLLLNVQFADGRSESTALMEDPDRPCVLRSEPFEELGGGRLYFGVVPGLVEHYHADIQSLQQETPSVPEARRSD